MRIISLQKDPFVSASQVIRDLERILCKHGYRGANWAIDTGLSHHQRIYEIPSEGAVCLNTTDDPSREGYASIVAFLGFNESESITLGQLEEDVNRLVFVYFDVKRTRNDY